MIQANIRSIVDNMIENNTFPSFSIISGVKGSGKHSLCRYIADKLNLEIIYFQPTAEDIDNFINIAYNQNREVLYVLEDMDTANYLVKYSILKITEEPVRYSKVILLCSTKDQLLNTILSRGVLFEIPPYTKNELKEYAVEKNLPLENIEQCLEICSYPGELEIALKSDLTAILKLTNNILENISRASLSNALSINTKLKTKDNKEGYDLNLFLNCMKYSILNSVTLKKIDIDKSISILNILSNIQSVRYFKGMNEKYLIDEFILRTWLIFKGVGYGDMWIKTKNIR